jgi:flagellar motility protein MotE (MotC chaperone)
MIRYVRVGFHAICGLVLLAAIAQVARADEHAGSAVSISEHAQKLEEKERALSQREMAIVERERLLEQREKDLDSRIQKLEALRATIQGEFEEQRKANEERVVKLVQVMETMTPKSASGVLENIDDSLAVEVLKRLETKRMAKILNIMDKNRSARLSELMTGYLNPKLAGRAGGRDSKDGRLPAQAAAPGSDSKKGGK